MILKTLLMPMYILSSKSSTVELTRASLQQLRHRHALLDDHERPIHLHRPPLDGGLAVLCSRPTPSLCAAGIATGHRLPALEGGNRRPGTAASLVQPRPLPFERLRSQHARFSRGGRSFGRDRRLVACALVHSPHGGVSPRREPVSLYAA
jgi:hypothetical protein